MTGLENLNLCLVCTGTLIYTSNKYLQLPHINFFFILYLVHVATQINNIYRWKYDSRHLGNSDTCTNLIKSLTVGT